MGVFGAASVAPEWDSIEDYVVGVECELDVGEGCWGGDDCSVDRMEGCKFAGVDAALLCDYVELIGLLVYQPRYIS